MNTSGSNNVVIGRQAATSITTGSNNIIIGDNADQANGSNQIRLGNASITNAYIQVGWTTTSDKRWKENIQSTSLGLDFIK